jgi:hypothetical protein
MEKELASRTAPSGVVQAVELVESVVEVVVVVVVVVRVVVVVVVEAVVVVAPMIQLSVTRLSEFNAAPREFSPLHTYRTSLMFSITPTHEV